MVAFMRTETRLHSGNRYATLKDATTRVRFATVITPIRTQIIHHQLFKSDAILGLWLVFAQLI
ncbi:hypothetical protein BGK40_09970 [Corynebacterium diphtheriae]|nr:hypothetical protein BGK40_09970 [Corynebacterium diphtheriae]